jgi:hypothetical protein
MDKASDLLMEVIDAEEQRLKTRLSDEDTKQHPLIRTLWR